MADTEPKLSSRSVRALIRTIERKKKALAKLRDEIRDLEDEAASLGGDCDEAHEELIRAADALSKLV